MLLPPLEATSLAATMAMMARTHQGLESAADGGAYGSLCAALGHGGVTRRDASGGTWDVGVVAKAVQQVAPDADWVEAARRLDMPELRVDTEASWRLLLALYRAGTSEPFPLETLVAAPGATGLWRNEGAQVSDFSSPLRLV